MAQNVGGTIARTGSWAARLNSGGSTPQPLGPLTQLAVQKGDVVLVTAPGRYEQTEPHNFWLSFASWLSSILHPTGGSSAGTDPTRTRHDLPLLQLGVAAGISSLQQLPQGVPQGYVRLLVFGRDSTLLDSKLQQLSASAYHNYEPLSIQLTVPQDGYVTAYVGNGSDVDVFFDDVTVEHRPGLQVQETQYDPAGLELAGLAPPSPGIKGLNNYRFNGKEFQADLGLSWNHQDWRFFDPQLLRWHVVDPKIEDGQESWTPYSFGYDNAVRYNDPDGQCPTCLTALAGAAIGAVIGAGIEAGTQMYQNGGHVSDWHAVGGAALQGGITGGVAGLTGGTSLLAVGAAGAVSNVAGGAARNVYDGKPVTVGSVAKDAVIGAVAGVGGHLAGKAVGAVASRLTRGAATEAEAGAGGAARSAHAPCGCFTAGTAVSLRRGRKPIEQIQVGDSVWAYNERTRQTALRPVTQLFRYERDTVYMLHTATGEAIRTTSDHPFYVRGQWVRVKRLRVGDSLVTQAGQRLRLLRIEVKPERVTVFNFTVDELHTYFVGSSAILVHNNGPCDLAIKETQAGKGNITSKHTLTESEALQAGEKFAGKNAAEIGKPNSGVYQSRIANADGTYNRFRMDPTSVKGTHDPWVPHVHLEIVKPGVKVPVVNNHIPIVP